MKKGVHPDYHTIKVVWTDGSVTETRSTYGKAGDTLQLDTDSISHVAWTKSTDRVLTETGSLSKFKSRYAGLGLGDKKVS